MCFMTEQYLEDLEKYRRSRPKPADHPVLGAASRGDIKELNQIFKQVLAFRSFPLSFDGAGCVPI